MTEFRGWYGTFHVPHRTLNDTREWCDPRGLPRPELDRLTLHVMSHVHVLPRTPKPYDWSKDPLIAAALRG